jgi:hypothetical protein
MATRSTIAIMNEDGSVRKIYCLWDGEPSHNGKILLEHYQDPEKIQQLMALGDISSLGAKVDGGIGHSFYNPLEGQTVSYNRDRGGTGSDAVVYPTIKKYHASNNMDGEYYHYLFKGGSWVFRSGDSTSNRMSLLKPKHCKN